MKRFTTALLTVAASAIMLTGCAAGGAAAPASTETGTEASTEAEPKAEEETKADADVIKIGTNAEFPPFEFVTAEGVIGEFDGIDMAMAKDIGETNGKEVKIENMEFDSLLIALQNGQIDAVISGMTITEERAKSVDFSVPYYEATQVMIVDKDSDIAKASDMEGKRIVVIQGYTGELCVQDLGYEYEAFKKGTEAILELNNGKCDVVVIDSATAQKYVKDNPNLKIVSDSDAFEAEQYGIAVKKGNTELLDMINKAIEARLKDGSISEWSAKYSE